MTRGDYFHFFQTLGRARCLTSRRIIQGNSPPSCDAGEWEAILTVQPWRQIRGCGSNTGRRWHHFLGSGALQACAGGGGGVVSPSSAGKHGLMGVCAL